MLIPSARRTAMTSRQGRVQWFNTERPHEYLDDFTPEAVEKLHYDHRRTPPKAG
jgi:transposase InsO family protein